MAAEFNIPPCESLLSFKTHIKYVLNYLDVRADQMGLRLARHIASASFPAQELADYRAHVFGCEPDMNAWTGKTNPRPYCDDLKLRSCGGHVHVGSGDLDKPSIIKSMDLHLGIPSLPLDPDTERRQLYGKAGAYRDKSYGAEYRTLSNFWIWHDQLIAWCWEGANRAVQFVARGNTIPEEIGLAIQAAINAGDKPAERLCLEYLADVQ